MPPIVDTKYWKHSQLISPGPVGSVGDTNVTVKLKHSMPDLPIRYDPWTFGLSSTLLGSNVQDGDDMSYITDGGPARVYDSNWQSGRSHKVSHGWYYQDLRVPDRRFEPSVTSTPSTYQNAVATTYKVNTVDKRFLPLPGPYMPNVGEIARGGTAPIVSAATSPDHTPIVGNRPKTLVGEVGISSIVSSGVPHLYSVV